MIKFFLGLPPVAQMAIVSFASIIAIMILKKGYTIAKTKDGWKFGPKEKDKEDVTDKGNRHMECEHFEDYKTTLFALAKLSYQLAILEVRNDLIETQMDYADRKGEAMISIMRSLYLSKLAEKTGNRNDVVKTRSFIIYEGLLEDVIQPRIKMILKSLFRKSNFASMSDAEFKMEKDDHIQSILQKITELLDKKYIYDDEISRVELFELNDSKKHEIIADFAEIIDQAKTLSADHQKKIDEVNDKIQLLLSGGKIDNSIDDIKTK